MADPLSRTLSAVPASPGGFNTIIWIDREVLGHSLIRRKQMSRFDDLELHSELLPQFDGQTCQQLTTMGSRFRILFGSSTDPRFLIDITLNQVEQLTQY
jgi:hypothetical protein